VSWFTESRRRKSASYGEKIAPQLGYAQRTIGPDGLRLSRCCHRQRQSSANEQTGAAPPAQCCQLRMMLSSSLQLDRWKMLAAREAVDVEFESNPALTTNSRLGGGAPRATWPSCSRFKARSKTSGPLPEVDFIRSS
jgi:hypothetical protein